MFELARIKGVLQALMAIAAILSAEVWLLRLHIDRWIEHIPHRHTRADIRMYQQVGGQATAFLRQVSAGAVQERSRRVGVILGSSTGECSVDPVEMDKQRGPSERWLNLHGAGCYALDLEKFVVLIDRMGLHPDRLVLALNRGMLADPSGEPLAEEPFRSSPLFEHLKARRFGLALRDVQGLLIGLVDAFIPRRLQVNHQAMYLFAELRFKMLRYSGQGFDLVFPPENPIWKGAKWTAGPRVPDFYLENQLHGFELEGWFCSGCFQPEGRNPSALVRLIQRARKMGAKMTILLVPESKVIRERTPASARACFDLVLRRAFPVDRVEVIDFIDALPEDAFHDAAHLNPEGRLELTRRLAAALSHQPNLADGEERTSKTHRVTPDSSKAAAN